MYLYLIAVLYFEFGSWNYSDAFKRLRLGECRVPFSPTHVRTPPKSEAYFHWASWYFLSAQSMARVEESVLSSAL